MGLLGTRGEILHWRVTRESRCASCYGCLTALRACSLQRCRQKAFLTSRGSSWIMGGGGGLVLCRLYLMLISGSSSRISSGYVRNIDLLCFWCTNTCHFYLKDEVSATVPVMVSFIGSHAVICSACCAAE